MKNTLILSLFYILLMGCIGCESFPEDKSTLLARKWKISNIENPEIKKNLAEASLEEKKSYQNNLIELGKNLVIEFKANGDYSRRQENTENPDNPSITNGKWSLSTDKKIIEISYSNNLKEVFPIIELNTERLIIQIKEGNTVSTFTLSPL